MSQLEQADVDTASRFLASTVPLVVTELAQRVPAMGYDADMTAAANLVMFQTWGLRVANSLADHLVAFSVAQLGHDQQGLPTCRILIPLDRIGEQVLTYCKQPAFTDYLHQSTRPLRFVDYCADLVQYVEEFYADEQFGDDEPRVDLVTEFYLLAGCNAFSDWAVAMAARVDELLS